MRKAENIAERQARDAGLLRRPVRFPLPAAVRRVVASSRTDVAGAVVHLSARLLSVVVPLAVATVGLAVALAAAALSVAGSERIGTLGIEVGAAMWFAGAVTLGARPRPTVLRVALLALTLVCGLALIGAAFVSPWSGVALDLAMEFGVGAVAVVLLDAIVLGVLQARLDALASDGRAT